MNFLYYKLEKVYKKAKKKGAKYFAPFFYRSIAI